MVLQSQYQATPSMGMCTLFFQIIHNDYLPRMLISHWQAAGAVGGALAIMEVMPTQYKHMLGGPSLKVDLHTGAIAEGILTFTISFLVLLVVLKGPKSPVLKTWLLAMATVTLVVSGSAYTGPSMNPANVSIPSLFCIMFPPSTACFAFSFLISCIHLNLIYLLKYVQCCYGATKFIFFR